VTLLWSKRRDDERAASRGGPRLEARDGLGGVLRDHQDAASGLAKRAGEREHLGFVREARRHRLAALAVVLTGGAGGETDGTGLHRLDDGGAHAGHLVGCRRTLRGVPLQSPRAQRRVADECRHVGADAAALEKRHVLGEGLELPLDAVFQRRERHPFHMGQIADRDVAVLGTARRDREPAVADDHRGHAELG
jgi:hypothetical protein